MKPEQQVIFAEDDAAASIQTVTGWVSRTGNFWGIDEHMARYDGSTHRHCDCGAAIEKKSYCRACHDRKQIERYERMPRQAWDGIGLIYSHITDRYYSDLEAAEDDLQDGQTLADLMLVICKPNYVRELTDEYCCDEMTEDGDLPNEVCAAMEAFNKAVSGIVLSWSPGDVSVLLDGVLHDEYPEAK